MEVPEKFRPVLFGSRYVLLALLFMLVSTYLVSCGGGGTTITKETTQEDTTTVADNLTIITGTTNVSANDQITVTAFATNNGVAVEGETISFLITINNSSSSLDALTAVTGPNGRASVTYTAGIITGVVDTITVRSTDLVETVDISINHPENAADNLIITATTNVTPGSESIVTAFATYNGVAVEGESISFLISTNNSGSSLDAVTVVTGANGRASVTYTAGIITGVIDTITVSSTDIVKTVAINVNPPGVDSVTITAGSDTLEAVVDVGANNQTGIVATVTGAAGAVVEGLTITFTTTAGTFCDFPNCTGATSTAQTDSTGIARIILQSSTNLETSTIQAQTPDLTTSNQIQVTFIAGPADNLLLNASPNNLTADGESTSTVTALVRDSANHIVADGVSVSFTVSAGDGQFGFLPVATVGGLASQTFTAGTDASINAGAVDVYVTAGSANSGTDGNGLITLIPEITGSISLSLGASTLTADGSDITDVTATVTNTDGLPINDGTTVTFTTTGGLLDDDFAAAPAAATTVTIDTAGGQGEAFVLLQSGTTAGQYFVTATAGSKTVTLPVDFIAGPADDTRPQTELTVSSPTIPADGFSTAILTLTAVDSNDNLVADGKTVTFTASAGTISNVTLTSNGVATATITSSTTATAGVNLSATIDGKIETATIDFGATNVTNPDSIVLNLTGGSDDPPSGTYLTVESPTGNDAITIAATVLDATGNPIGSDCPDNTDFIIVSGPVGVKLDGNTGAYPYTETKTTVDGIASVSLTAGTAPGTVRVRVTASQDTGDCNSLTPQTVSVITTPITIASGEAAQLTVFTSQNVIDNQDGTISMSVNALVQDLYGNPVENNTAVIFSLKDNTDPGVPAAPPIYGTICGATVTGNAEGDCASVGQTSVDGIKGVAHSLLTWVAEGIFNPYEVTAATDTGLALPVSDTFASTYPGIAPVSINVSINPSSVVSGTTGITVTAEYTDGGNFPNPIFNRELTFSSSNPALADFSGAPDTDVTNIDGFAQLDTLDTSQCLDTTSVTITVADPPYSGSATLNISGTAPVASFTSANVGALFTFTNTSTEPAGYSYTYSWNIDSGSYTSAVENPAFDFTADSGNTLPVVLTVTNDAPGACSDVVTGSVTVP